MHKIQNNSNTRRKSTKSSIRKKDNMQSVHQMSGLTYDRYYRSYYVSWPLQQTKKNSERQSFWLEYNNIIKYYCTINKSYIIIIIIIVYCLHRIGSIGLGVHANRTWTATLVLQQRHDTYLWLIRTFGVSTPATECFRLWTGFDVIL